MKFDFIRTFLTRLDGIDVKRVKELYESMASEAEPLLSETEYAKRYSRAVDMRYWDKRSN